jgi:hypothetical protein
MNLETLEDLSATDIAGYPDQLLAALHGLGMVEFCDDCDEDGRTPWHPEDGDCACPVPAAPPDTWGEFYGDR